MSELELAAVADISVGAQELAEVADISAGAIHRVGQLSQFMHIKHFQFGWYFKKPSVTQETMCHAFMVVFHCNDGSLSQLGEIIFKSCLQFEKKNKNYYKYHNKHDKINIMIVFWFSKIEISWKLAKKGDFRKFVNQFLDFTLKRVPEINAPHIYENLLEPKLWLIEKRNYFFLILH